MTNNNCITISADDLKLVLQNFGFDDPTPESYDAWLRLKDQLGAPL